MKQIYKDYLELHFIVFIWGFTAILGMLISLEPVELVFWRTFLTFSLLVPVLMWRKVTFRVNPEGMVKMLGTGVIIAWHWITFFLAARLSNVSVCLAGLATVSLWTSFIEPVLNKRKIKSFEVVLGMFAVAGILLIFQYQGNYWLGLLVAILSAFLSAFFSVINGRLTKGYDAYQITFYEMIGAWIGIVLYLPFYHIYFSAEGIHLGLTLTDFVWVGILAFACTVYPFASSVELMRRISAFAVNLTVNLEPVYGIILALIIFREDKYLNWGFYAGTLVILLAVLAYPLLNKWYMKRKGLTGISV